MNIGAIIPPPNIGVSNPIKVSPRGNLYKMSINHTNGEGKNVNKYEVWATKEAVQKHFEGMMIGEEPKDYELKKFARQMYEKHMRSSGGQLQHKGMLVTTDNVTHGDPRLWPSTLSHPEVKI